MRSFVTILLLTAFAGCAQRAGAVAEEQLRDTSTLGEVYQAESPEWTIATPRQRCYVEAFVENDLPRRDCMVPCILEGGAALIGGGCWHICYAYPHSGLLPSRTFFRHCPAAEPYPVPEPPSVSCSADANRSIRVEVVDAETGGPIDRSRITVYSADERLQFDVSGHVQVEDPPGGPMKIHVFARRYFPSSVSLYVAERQRCVVRHELVTTRGHGF